MKFITKTVRIAREALEFALEASKAIHPNEFIGLLREEEGLITSILIVPGSIGGEDFSEYNPYMLPLSSNSCGVVHSHPNESNRPSSADLNLFSKSGSIHAIICYPYTEKTIQFYDGDGRKLGFEIV